MTVEELPGGENIELSAPAELVVAPDAPAQEAPAADDEARASGMGGGDFGGGMGDRPAPRERSGGGQAPARQAPRSQPEPMASDRMRPTCGKPWRPVMVSKPSTVPWLTEIATPRPKSLMPAPIGSSARAPVPGASAAAEASRPAAQARPRRAVTSP